MPLGLPVPITASGRSATSVQATRAAASMPAALPPAIAPRQTPQRFSGCKRIFEDLSLLLDQAFYPAAVAVVKQAASIMRRDDLIAAGTHLSLRRINRLLAQELRDQPHLIAVLDVDQPALAHQPVIPQR